MLGGDSDVDGKLTHPAFGLDFILNGTAGDRNSNASTTGKAELDDPPFIIGSYWLWSLAAYRAQAHPPSSPLLLCKYRRAQSVEFFIVEARPVAPRQASFQ